MKIISALALAVLAVPAAAAPPLPPNPFQQRLLQLDKPRQAAALRSAIVDSGQRCGRIEPPVYQGIYKNTFVWAARCAPGGEYALFLGPDGSVQLRHCAETAKLGLPACKLPPPTVTLKRRS